MFESDAGVGRGELPLRLYGGVVSRGRPCAGFPREAFDFGQASSQALTLKHGEFDLGHVQPASVFWRVMDLQAVAKTLRLGGSEGFVKRGAGVRVEIVHHENDLLRMRIMRVAKIADQMCPVHPRPPLRHLPVTPTRERFEEHEEVGEFNSAADFLAQMATEDLDMSQRFKGLRIEEEVAKLQARCDYCPGHTSGWSQNTITTTE